MVVTHFTFGQTLLELDGGLGPRLERLARSGSYAYLRRMPQQVEVELIGESKLMIYRDQDVLDLGTFFPGIDRPAAFLLTSRQDLPPGTQLKARVGTSELDAQVLILSRAELEVLDREQVLLLPASWTPQLEDRGYVEIALFESGSKEASVVREQIQTIRQLLTLDGIQGANLQAGIHLLERLQALREEQALWSTLMRATVASLIILVFASTAFLEYRENAYLSALLQSLGVSRFFLFLRYLVEHALLILAGFSLAVGALTALLRYPAVLPLDLPAGLDELLSFTHAFQAWSSVLLVTLLLSLIPILIGLRKEIGRILQ